VRSPVRLPHLRALRRAGQLAATRRCAALFAVVLCLALTTGASGQSRSFLWKATKGTGTIYLAGSVHMLSKDYYPLSPAFDAAFAESDLLVEELDFAEMLSPDAQMMMLTRGLLPGGQSVDTVVSKDTLAMASGRAAALGLPFEPLRRFKPWALALTLLALEWQKAGFDAALGLDRHFYDRAQASGRAVQGLETIEFQVSRFDEMSMPDQDRMLVQSLKEVDSTTAQVTSLANAWKTGDAAAVERVVLGEMKNDPALYRRLIVERNRAWLPKIEALFTRTRPAFVVVGAAHLTGPDGLLAALRAKGYTLEQR
jgi:uncharacterized protein